MRFIDTLSGLADLVWPPRCAACGTRVGAFEPADPASGFCPVCATSLMPITSPMCPRCAFPFEGEGGDHLCGECLLDPPAFETARALFQYGEAAAKAVTRLKYGVMPHLAEVMGRMLLPAVSRLGAVDLVVPVPLHRSRLVSRGFNQSALLAQPISRWIAAPLAGNAVVRTRATASQAGLNREDRRKNLRGAFSVPIPGCVAEKRVLVVDDVVTTGTTVRELSRCLMQAGAKSVVVVAFARAC